MPSLKIAILDDYQSAALTMAAWDSLPEAQVQSFSTASGSEDDLVRRLQPFDVVVAMRERTAFPASVIERLPNLKLLASTGMTNAAIDIEACERRGVVTCGSPGGAHGLAATAETAWALILAHAKRVLLSHQGICDGMWQPAMAEALEGRTLGIVGLGRIGRRMARIGQAFGMDVVAWSPNLTEERAAQAKVLRVEKKELFATADVVTLHLVLSAATERVVGRDELAAMKSTSLLVNTARAGLVDESALLEALHDRRIGGAGLDVFWEEPLSPGNPLCALDNVVLTPHLGYVTRENIAAFYRGVLDNITTWLAGGVPPPLRP